MSMSWGGIVESVPGGGELLILSWGVEVLNEHVLLILSWGGCVC